MHAEPEIWTIFQVYPAEIVGKRQRVRLDGSRLHKIHLDKNQQTNIEHKVSRCQIFFRSLQDIMNLIANLDQIMGNGPMGIQYKMAYTDTS